MKPATEINDRIAIVRNRFGIKVKKVDHKSTKWWGSVRDKFHANKETIIDMINSDYSLKKIAKDLDIPYSSLLNWVYREIMPKKNATNSMKICDINRDEIIEDLKNGVKKKDIAASLDLEPWALLTWLKTRNIKEVMRSL